MLGLGLIICSRCDVIGILSHPNGMLSGVERDNHKTVESFDCVQFLDDGQVGDLTVNSFLYRCRHLLEATQCFVAYSVAKALRGSIHGKCTWTYMLADIVCTVMYVTRASTTRILWRDTWAMFIQVSKNLSVISVEKSLVINIIWNITWRKVILPEHWLLWC